MHFYLRITRRALDLGFLAVGFCRPGPPPFLAEYNQWVDAGKYGNMRWLQDHRDLKADPGKVLECCETIISLGFPYPSKKPSTSDEFTAARYTRPESPDYHDSIKERAKSLVALISEEYPGERSRICVDSAPLLERGFAYASGIGFIGKNNMLIRPGHGSYFFLAEVLTTALFPIPAVKPMVSLCGRCSRCVEACPTGALERPFLLDAAKCLSYLTIEKKGSIDRKTGKKMGGCFFGCDVCQEVCPFNPGPGEREKNLPSLEAILQMDQKTFKNQFGNTSFARAGLEKIKSNIRTMAEGVFPQRREGHQDK
jgi:epoxyqueuosine reductase